MKLGNHSIRIGGFKVELNKLSQSSWFYIAERNDISVGGKLTQVKDHADLMYKLTKSINNNI